MIRRIYHDIDDRRKESAVEALHLFLVEGSDRDTCTRKILYFLESYQLVRYGKVDIVEEDSLPAASPAFPEKLEEGLKVNRRRLRSFLAELQEEGFETLESLGEMTQGYPSKTLHTVAHLVDGFFGIDSHFFNLVEGSHWVTDGLREQLTSSPEKFMLVAVQASI
jgi:hypothetical protein